MKQFVNNFLVLTLAIDATFNDLNFFRIPELTYIILVLTGINFFLFTKTELRNRLTSTFFLFTFFSVVIIIFNSSKVSNSGITALSFNLPIVIKYWLYFFLGLNFSFIYPKILFFAIVVVFIGFGRLLSDDLLFIDYSLLFDPSDRTVMASSSDILSLFVVLYSIKTKGVTKVSLTIVLLMFVISLYLIFIGGSRTTFVLLILSFFAFLGVSVKLMALSLGGVFLLSKTIGEYVLNLDALEGYRLVRLFNVSEDDSAIARNILLDSGIKDISDNPFFGKFGGQLTAKADSGGKRWGAYIHNCLSYYRQFGFLVFIIFIIIYLKSTIGLFKLSKKFIPLLLLLSTSVIISRSYAFGYLFIVTGIYICEIEKNRNESCKIYY